MSFNMAAILRINAQVSGTGEVQKLNTQLGQTGPAAQKSVAGVSALGRAIEDVGKISAGIGLANLTGRLGGFASTAVSAGDETMRLESRIKGMASTTEELVRIQEFAAIYAKRFSVSQLEAGNAVSLTAARMRPLGFSLKEIESLMLGVSNAGSQVGATSKDVSEVLRQLAQGAGTGALAWGDLMIVLERIPPLAAAVTKAINDVAKDKGLELISKQQASAMIRQVEQGEREQTKKLKEGLEARTKEVEKAADEKLKLIRRKYGDELEALSDSLDEQERLRREKSEEALDDSLKRLGRQFREERKALRRFREDQDQEIAEMFETIGDGFYRYFAPELGRNVFTVISEEQKKAIERRIEDQREAEDDALSDREEEARKSIQRQADEEARIRDKAAQDEREKREQAIMDRQEKEESAVKETLENQKAALQRIMDEQMEINKKATADAIKNIRDRTEAQITDLKKLAAEGRITTEVVKRVGANLQDAEIPPSTPVDRFNASMGDLSQTIGERITPRLEKLVGVFEGFENFVDKLPGWSKDLGILAASIIGIGGAIKGAGALFGLSRGVGGAGRMSGPPGPMAPPTASPLGGGRLSSGVPGAPGAAPAWALGPPKTPPTPPSGPGALKGIADAVRAASGGLTQAGKALADFTAGALGNLSKIGAAFSSLRIGATIAGWAGAVGPFVTTVTGALQGLISWVGGTAVPTLAGFFSGPAGWAVLAGAGLVTAAIVWREPIRDFMDYVAAENDKLAARIEPALEEVGDKVTETIAGSAKSFRNMVEFENKAMDEFFAGLYEDFGKGIEAKIQEIKDKGLGKVLKNDIAFESKVWDQFFVNLYEDFGKGIEEKISDLAGGVGDAFGKAGQIIKNELNYILAICENSINSFVSAANDGIASVNKVSSRIGIPSIPMISEITIPRLARGGWADRATLVEIGEGGDPGGEYAIPARSMPAAIEAWNRGARGNELIRAMQSPGLAPGRAMGAPGAGGGAGPVTVAIRTGPVIQQPDGSQWLRLDDVPAIVEAAAAAARRGRG